MKQLPFDGKIIHYFHYFFFWLDIKHCWHIDVTGHFSTRILQARTSELLDYICGCLKYSEVFTLWHCCCFSGRIYRWVPRCPQSTQVTYILDKIDFRVNTGTYFVPLIKIWMVLGAVSQDNHNTMTENYTYWETAVEQHQPQDLLVMCNPCKCMFHPQMHNGDSFVTFEETCAEICGKHLPGFVCTFCVFSKSTTFQKLEQHTISSRPSSSHWGLEWSVLHYVLLINTNWKMLACENHAYWFYSKYHLIYPTSKCQH